MLKMKLAALLIFLFMVASPYPLISPSEITYLGEPVHQISSVSPSSNFDPPLLSWISNENSTPTSVETNSIIESDEVVLIAQLPDNENDPDYFILNITMNVFRGFILEKSGELNIPKSSYDSFSGPIVLNEFSWSYIESIEEGDNVSVQLDFTNHDCDVMAWWADLDNSTWSFGNNLLSDQMATFDKPETGSFIASRCGSLMFGIFNYNRTPSDYNLSVDTRITKSNSTYGNRVLFNTRTIFKNNVTFSVGIFGSTDSCHEIVFHFGNITINQYFSPRVLVDPLVGKDGYIVEIDWTITDRNQMEEHYSELLLSNDQGRTYQFLIRHLSTTIYSFDFTGFLFRDTYRFKVNSYDNDPRVNYEPIGAIYWPGLGNSAESHTFNQEGIPTPIVPVISQPLDVEYIEGESESTITWHLICTDSLGNDFRAWYYLSRNGSIIQEGRLSSGSVNTSVAGLTPGTYIYRLGYGYNQKWVSDYVTVSVLSRNYPDSDRLPQLVIISSGIILIFLAIPSIKRRVHLDFRSNSRWED